MCTSKISQFDGFLVSQMFLSGSFFKVSDHKNKSIRSQKQRQKIVTTTKCSYQLFIATFFSMIFFIRGCLNANKSKSDQGGTHTKKCLSP